MGAEVADAIFQAAITAGLAVFALVLYRRIRATWLAWWAAAWGLYVLRLGAIIAFLLTDNLVWLFWHQVATGWVALTILFAALVFSRNARWRPWYAALASLPLLLGWVAVNGLDRFMLVAVPMVALISGATLWTGWVFWRHADRTGSRGARFVAIGFVLWGLHHLDYPFLRARGAWQPWGYFLDIAFELAVAIGFGLMVMGDLAGRLATRTEELGRLQTGRVRSDEQQRRRLARELHDETAQTLSAARLEVGLLQEGADPATQERLAHLLRLMDDGIRGVRRAVNDLRPALLDDLGLVPALRALVDEVDARGGVTARAELDHAIPRLDDDSELALFRAAQEAIANVIRHAGASGLSLRLQAAGDRVILTVSDDGRGFPNDFDQAALEREGHFGLAGMRERIATLGGEIQLGRDGGATLRVELPLKLRERTVS